MFLLSEDDADYLLSKNAIPTRKHLGGTLPYLFTEQGVAGIDASDQVKVLLGWPDGGFIAIESVFCGRYLVDQFEMSL